MKVNILCDSGAPSLYNKLAKKNKDAVMGSSFKDRINDDHSYIETEEYSIFRQGYADFVKEHRASLYRYFNLDVINDVIGTRRNQLWMEDNGLAPVPVFHLGEDEKILEKMVADYDYIALGGLIPNPTNVLVPILDRLFKEYFLDENGKVKVKIHGLAATSLKLIERYPWYSVDSTSWRKLAAYGKIYFPSILEEGRPAWGKKPMMLPVSKKNIKTLESGQHFQSYPPDVKKKIIEIINHYGYDFADLEKGYESRSGWNAFYFQMLQKQLKTKIFLAAADRQTIPDLEHSSKISKEELNLLFSYYYLRSAGSSQYKAWLYWSGIDKTARYNKQKGENMARRRKTAKPEVKKEKQKGVNKKQFLDSLSKVKPGIADKAIIEQSTHFIFDGDRIWSYNDEISVSHKFKTGVTGALIANKLFKLCEKIEDETIQIIQGETGIIIKGNDFETSLSIDSEIKLKKITVPRINSQKWKPLPADFIEGIKLCFFSASTNMVKPELTCLYISGKNILSTDTYRGTKYTMEDSFDGKFIIPARIAVKLQNYNPVKMMEDDHWLHFINKEGTVFSCRTYDATYPEKPLQKIFDMEGEQIILPESFSKVVERASVLISEDFALDRVVTITIDTNKITCSGEGIDGWYKETKKIDYSGDKIEVMVQPEFLNQILNQLDIVTIGDSQLLFEGEKFKHFMRLSG